MVADETKPGGYQWQAVDGATPFRERSPRLYAITIISKDQCLCSDAGAAASV